MTITGNYQKKSTAPCRNKRQNSKQSGRRAALQTSVLTPFLSLRQQSASPPQTVLAFLSPQTNKRQQQREKKIKQPAWSSEIALTHFVSSIRDLLPFFSAIFFFKRFLFMSPPLFSQDPG